MDRKNFFAVLAALVVAATAFVPATSPAEVAEASYRFADFMGKAPIHVYRAAQKSPAGVTPLEIKRIYNLPARGGQGTVAIIEAYDDPRIEHDLNVFSDTYGLPKCTVVGGCFEKHKMSSSTASNGSWALETSLDVEWAHAIAPNAKILLVEAKTPSGENLLRAVDYAAARKDVVAISMSWGGAEFSEETSLDPHFVSKSGAVFFAASGDNGAGATWPAASPYVVGVGGTSLALLQNGKFVSESAWPGSGGGVSAYEKQPDFQKTYSIPKAKGMRAVPDVAYNADPKSGYVVYRSTNPSKGGWYTVGGTSAGAPQWAAIHALNRSISLPKLYADKAATSTSSFFRDITSGSNGACTYYCDARKRYDYVTGLGTPLTAQF